MSYAHAPHEENNNFIFENRVILEKMRPNHEIQQHPPHTRHQSTREIHAKTRSIKLISAHFTAKKNPQVMAVW